MLCALAALLSASASARAEWPFEVTIGSDRLEAPARERSPDPQALPDGWVAGGARDVRGAWYVMPTGRYGHGVLGDAVEAGGLRVVTADGRTLTFTLDAGSVFEDLAPRLADLDGDGRDELLAVRSYLDAGAALAVLGVRDGGLALLAETAPIGTPNRWLAPAGSGDFDGDGRLEVAYVDRPHILGMLRIVRLEAGALVEIARLQGFSNHGIGSRALGQSAVLDVEGDGRDELMLPLMGRRGLALVGWSETGLGIRARLELPAAIATDVESSVGGGAIVLRFGLADGQVVTLRRPR